jgi:hypothetical protein
VQNESATFKGVVRGQRIELDRPVDLPDGQEVTVMVQPANGTPLAPGEVSAARSAVGPTTPKALTSFSSGTVSGASKRVGIWANEFLA